MLTSQFQGYEPKQVWACNCTGSCWRYGRCGGGPAVPSTSTSSFIPYLVIAPAPKPVASKPKSRRAR